MHKPIKITALTADELATLLNRASRSNLSGQDVLAIARTAGIVGDDGRINLLKYTAFLVREVAGDEI